MHGLDHRCWHVIGRLARLEIRFEGVELRLQGHQISPWVSERRGRRVGEKLVLSGMARQALRRDNPHSLEE